MSAEPAPAIERVLRRERSIAIAGIVVITVLAWSYVLAGAGTGNAVSSMTSLALFPHKTAQMPMNGMAMSGMPVQDTAWAASYWFVMLLMWWVMMIAMMTPSAAPMILLNARATRHARDAGRLNQSAVPSAAFVAGYLLSWFGFSVAATFLTWALTGAHLVSAMTMSSASARLSAAVLCLAGIYQLSPLKRVCLQHCRNPVQFLSRHWKPGAFGALRMGLEHGAFCVGCCWMLMALLFVGGIMNVLWIAALSLVVIVEKIAVRGPRFAWVGGVTLLLWGAATLVV